MLATYKTHCTKGHEYTLESVCYGLRDRRRICILCNNLTKCKNGHNMFGDNLYVATHRPTVCVKCKECTRISIKLGRRKLMEALGENGKNKYHRMRNLEFTYNMSLEDYEERLSKQGRKCANQNCDNVFTNDKKLHIDHDHSCCNGRKTCGKCIRGLLCNKCNRVLGMINDSETCLKGLIEYLAIWKTYTKEYMLEEMKTTL